VWEEAMELVHNGEKNSLFLERIIFGVIVVQGALGHAGSGCTENSERIWAEGVRWFAMSLVLGSGAVEDWERIRVWRSVLD
jgi:hypothetical protein